MEKRERGEIIEALPSLKFRVQFEGEKIRLCYLAGKLYKNFIKIIVGDKVEVVIPAQGDIGRIIRRL